MYNIIYENLCKQGKSLKEEYENRSYKEDLHKHHIIPKHSGGLDIEENYTYLTIRQHVIAHYLLWKINKNPNDLRSMNMLGANLTYKQRKIVGEWCRDNKIGFHGYPSDKRKEWAKKGYLAQKEVEGSFHWWSTEEGRKKRASLGGKASIESGNNKEWLFWMSPEGIRLRGHMGGKTHIGKIWIFKDEITTRVTPEDLEEYISDGWQLGLGTNKGMKNNIGKIWIHHKSKGNTLIDEDSLDMYLKEGWIIGRNTENYASKGKIKVTNGKQNKLIHPSELEKFLAEGWIRGGMKRKTTSDI